MTVVTHREEETGRSALTIYGRLAVSSLAGGTFRVGTLSRQFVAPAEAGLAALDGLHVRVQIDGLGHVLAINVPWDQATATY
jgi:hypothetical protein